MIPPSGHFSHKILFTLLSFEKPRTICATVGTVAPKTPEDLDGYIGIQQPERYK